MGWNPSEDLGGWQPEGWQPGESDSVAPRPPRARFFVRAHLARFATFRARFIPVIPYADDVRLFEPVPKDPGRELDVELSLYDLCAAKWVANRDYTTSEFALPRIATGFAYEATTGGRSGAREPVWPRTVGATVQDGGITWTCRAAGSNAMYALSDPSAVSDPLGLTISSVAVSADCNIHATYEGGTLGRDYDVVYTVTLNGKTVVFRQPVKVRKQ